MQVGSSNSTILNNINHKKDTQTEDIKKLSSGEEDKTVDPGIAIIAQAMMTDIVTDTEGIKNANTASSMMQIADGSLSQVSDMTSKLEELSVASNNGALNSSDQNALKAEFNKTVDSINSTISNSTFNGKSLFGQDMTFSLGSSDISVSLGDINTSELDINSQDSIKDFTKQVNSSMSNIGSTQNSIQSSADNLINSMTQKSEARSQMSDVDMAELVSKYKDDDVKLQSSLLTNAHQQNLSSQRVATLLE